MIGRVVDSLNARVRQEEADWRSTNPVFLREDFGPMRSALLFLSERPLLALASVLILTLVLSAAVIFLPPPYPGPAQFALPAGAQVNEFFIAIWSVQATLTAIVFPIVIGLVAVFLQKQHSSKVSLHIYFTDSAAILAGLAGLGLVALMAVQHLMLMFEPRDVVHLWLVMDGTWLVLNVALTVFFLTRTFAFTSPVQRAALLHRYTIVRIWPAEWRLHLARAMAASPFDNGLLPGPSFADLPDNDSRASINLFEFEREVSRVAVLHVSRKRTRLRDIWYRPLRWAIRRWLVKANKSPAQLGGQQAAGVAGNRSKYRSPILTIAIRPGAVKSGEIPLVTVARGPELGALSTALVRLSFHFSRALGGGVSVQVSDALAELKAELLEAMGTESPTQYEERYREFSGLLETLVESGAFRNGNGAWDNWVLLPDWRSPVNNEIVLGWYEHLRDIVEVALNKLEREPRYFGTALRLPLRLFLRVRDRLPSPLARRFLQMQSRLTHKLLAWWVRRFDEQQPGVRKTGAFVVLNEPLGAIYRNTLKDAAVSSWETFKNEILPDSTLSEDSWGNQRALVELFEQHLAATSNLVISAFDNADREGFRQLLDVLLKWREQLRHEYDSANVYVPHEAHLTLSALRARREEAEKTLALEGEEYPPAVLQKALVAIVLDNFWKDACCVAGYLLALRSREIGEPSHPITGQALGAIFCGRPFVRDNATAQPGPLFAGADELLLAILRQHFLYRTDETPFSTRLDKLVEQSTKQPWENGVPGRVYTRVGEDNLDSVSEGLLFALTLLTQPGWNPESYLEELIQTWRDADDRRRDLAEKIPTWIAQLTEPRFLEFKDLYRATRTEAGAPSFEDAIAAVRAGLEALLALTRRTRDADLAGMQPDPAVLAQLATEASTLAFGSKTGGAPISLFHKVSLVRDALPHHRAAITNWNKGKLTTPPMAQRSANEGDALADALKGAVAVAVLADAVKALACIERDAYEPNAYWNALKEFATLAAGARTTPVLLIPGRVDPAWLYDWMNRRTQRTPAPAELSVRRASTETIPEYVGHINGIAVFTAPVAPGESYLLMREALDTLKFTEWSPGVCVQLSASPGETPQLIKLEFEWGQEVTVKPFKAIHLLHRKKGA